MADNRGEGATWGRTVPDDLPHVHFPSYLTNIQLGLFDGGSKRVVLRYRTQTDEGWSKWKTVPYFPDVVLGEEDEDSSYT